MTDIKIDQQPRNTMLDEQEKKRAGAMMGNLLDRQNQMTSDDPFALMKSLTDNF